MCLVWCVANKLGLNPHLRAFRRSWEEIGVMEERIIEERRAQRTQRRAQDAQGGEEGEVRGEMIGGREAS